MPKNLVRKLLSGLLCMVMLMPGILAQAAAAQTQNLNLGSWTPSTRANLSDGSHPVLNVGGRPVSVHNGQLLTPAESLALQQVLGSGRQSILLNHLGVAVGGQAIIPSSGGVVSNLIVPRGVTVLADFSNSSGLALNGLLSNFGNFFGFTTSNQTLGADIAASSIRNARGGLISTLLPQQLSLDLKALPALDLTLQAGNILNAGTISSSGALHVLSNRISNTGLISALNDINIEPLTTPGVRIAGSGTWQSAQGNINITAPAATSTKGIVLSGGNYLSNELNLDAGKGTIAGSIRNVTGVINVTACQSTLGAATPDLKLGLSNVSGDPTYFNTAGDLTVSSLSNTAGADLALIASGDVIISTSTIDTTKSTGGAGGSLLVVAGANVTGGVVGTNDKVTTLSITQGLLGTHGSVTGGSIQYTGGSALTINTNGTLTLNSPGGNGGNVTMVAFSGTQATSPYIPGTINLGTTGSINTFGGGSSASANATNGNVKLIAGATSDPIGGAALTVPAIFTGWSADNTQAGIGGGDVSIWTALPTLGTVTVLDGSLKTGNFSASATILPTSITLGSTGGAASVTVSNSVSQWQTDAANYALSVINQMRADEGFGPVTLNASLSRPALAFAQYLAQTQRFNHYTLNGAGPLDRGTASGISAGSYSENFAYEYGPGVTIKQAFDDTNAQEFAEPNVNGTHHYNLTHFNYVGMGFANVGDLFFVVQDFTNLDPTNNSPPNPFASVHGGIAGGAGLISASGATPDTVSSVGSEKILPVSINTASGNVTINAGNNINAAGLILANGISSLAGSGGNGGNVTITAANAINLAGIQSTGGLGAQAAFGNLAVGATGGAGGAVSVTTSNGNLSILPPAPCSPCFGVAVSGGAGGQALDSDAAGGAGGNAGSILLSAPNGNVTVSALAADGGGGSGGSGGTSGGAGGKGGNAGSITVTSGGSLTVQNYVSASGGGGGGAGAKDASGNAGGGGGGGSFGSGGSGGAAGNSAAGGGGGTTAEVPGFGGPSQGNILSPVSTAGVNGTAGSNGGAAGTFGNGGGGGTSTANGGAGGAAGVAGGSASGNSGGAAGNGGAINLSAKLVLVEGTLDSFWSPMTSASKGTRSLLALGPGGTVQVTASGAVNPQFPNSLNLSDSSKSVKVNFGSPFVIGSLAGGNGTAGGIEAGAGANPITINGAHPASPATSGSFGSLGGGGTLSIQEGAGTLLINDGDFLTPAEYIAMLQVSETQSQPLVLTASGTAGSPGTFSLTAARIPVGGFTQLVIPAGVTMFDSAANLSFSIDATVNGSLTINNGNAVTLLTTPSFALNGSLTDQRGTVRINSPTVTLGPAATMTTAGLSISANSLSIGAGATVTTGNGVLTLPTSLTLGNSALFSAKNLIVVSPTLNLADGSHIKGTNISIAGNTASGLTISGGTTTDAFVKANRITLSTSSAGTAISLLNHLILDGVLMLVAPAAGQSVNVGANVQTVGLVEVDTPSLIGNLTATQITMLTAGSIINPTGDVILPASIVLNGKSLAILASGNIVGGTKVTSINLSNTAGAAGNLTMIAGVSFPGSLIVGQQPLGPGNVTVGSPSATGGSIYLPRATINTSSTAIGMPAGDVTAIANASASNAGSILLGAINASASKNGGTGGNVFIAAPGGISTNAITTAGANGGSVTLSAAPVTKLVDGTIIDGILVGTPYLAGAVAAQSNSTVLVNGAIATSGFTGAGGSVSIEADGKISITKSIVTTALSAGGDAILRSSGGLVSVGIGGINTSGINITSTTSSALGGTAGNIGILGTVVTVNGSLQANGASTKGSGGGGDGGNVTLTTNDSLELPTVKVGFIKVTGFISAKGGNASSLGGNGGAGGSFFSDSAQIQITAASGGASINVLHGLGGTAGASGTVQLSTYAVQPLTTNFDLLSTKKSVAAIPGGLFTVGIGSPVNGVAGSILSADGTFTKKSVNNSTGLVFAGTTNLPATGVINVSASSATLNNGTLSINAASNTGVRTLVTPTMALALVQTTRGEPQGISLSATNTAAPASAITLDQFEIVQPFTAFKMPAATSLSIAGTNPIITLPTSTTLSGAISFTTSGATAFLDAGSGAFKLNSGGSISAPGSTLIISTKTSSFSNSGLISANSVALARPATSALTVSDLGAGDIQTVSGVVLSPSLDAAISMNFRALGTHFGSNIKFGQLSVPVAYSTLALNYAKNYLVAPVVNLTFGMGDPNKNPIAANIGGSITASSITISAFDLLWSTGPVPTPVNISNNASLSSNKNTTIYLSGPLTIGNSVTMNAGVLNNPPPLNVAQSFVPSDVKTSGQILIQSLSSIQFGNTDHVISNGGSIVVLAKGGNLQLGSNNVFQANGGNLQMLASGTVVGQNNNWFFAGAVGSPASFKGGGIEIGSGLTSSSAISSAFSLPTGTVPNPTSLLGAGVILGPTMTGAVVVKESGGGFVDLHTGVTASTIQTAGGVVVFDALNGHSVQLDNAFFGTSAWKPAGNAESAQMSEVIVDSGEDAP